MGGSQGHVNIVSFLETAQLTVKEENADKQKKPWISVGQMDQQVISNSISIWQRKLLMNGVKGV